MLVGSGDWWRGDKVIAWWRGGEVERWRGGRCWVGGLGG
jgi:hypothetical protein